MKPIRLVTASLLGMAALAACSSHSKKVSILPTTTTSESTTSTSAEGSSTLSPLESSTTAGPAPAATASTLPHTSTTARATTAPMRRLTSTTSTSTAAPATTMPPGDPRLAKVKLVTVATLSSPSALAVRDGDSAIYVTERTGRVRRILNGGVDPTPLLDISSEVSLNSERGLLGIAFAPGGAKFYVDFTDQTGDIHITEFTIANGTSTARRDLLVIPHRQFGNHNGGQLAFGRDGFLYIGVGDGGGSGDPNGNGQSLGTLLGKILRIDVHPSASAPYSIPASNPFVDRSGARPEIWAFGLRNPWRFSFDRATGDLWIGDVGQDAYEEVDRAPASSTGGENYEWSLREGTHPFHGGARPPGGVDPVYDYSHDTGGCSISGGYVYRGSAIRALNGAYLFTDYCQSRIRALTLNGSTPAVTDLGISGDQIVSFGQDQAGELYTLSITGAVQRIAPA
jgi:glucose/arabinose dehydrogenase